MTRTPALVLATAALGVPSLQEKPSPLVTSMLPSMPASPLYTVTLLIWGVIPALWLKLDGKL